MGTHEVNGFKMVILKRPRFNLWFNEVGVLIVNFAHYIQLYQHVRTSIRFNAITEDLLAIMYMYFRV